MSGINVTVDVNSVLTIFVVAYAISCVYRYSVKKLETIQQPLVQRRLPEIDQ